MNCFTLDIVIGLSYKNRYLKIAEMINEELH